MQVLRMSSALHLSLQIEQSILLQLDLEDTLAELAEEELEVDDT
jgi:hypothetical protein